MRAATKKKDGIAYPRVVRCICRTALRYCGIDELETDFRPASRSRVTYPMNATECDSVTGRMGRPSALQNETHVFHCEFLIEVVRSLQAKSLTMDADLAKPLDGGNVPMRRTDCSTRDIRPAARASTRGSLRGAAGPTFSGGVAKPSTSPPGTLLASLTSLLGATQRHAKAIGASPESAVLLVPSSTEACAQLR